MSEWSKEHAWKAIPASCTERHRNTSSHNRFSDLRLADVPRCDAVNDGIRRQFRPHLTQFLHSSAASFDRVHQGCSFVYASNRRVKAIRDRTRRSSPIRLSWHFARISKAEGAVVLAVHGVHPAKRQDRTLAQPWGLRETLASARLHGVCRLARIPALTVENLGSTTHGCPRS